MGKELEVESAGGSREVHPEVSARVQDVMIVAQVGALLLFAVVALFRVYAGTAPEGSLVPKPS